MQEKRGGMDSISYIVARRDLGVVMDQVPVIITRKGKAHVVVSY